MAKPIRSTESSIDNFIQPQTLDMDDGLLFHLCGVGGPNATYNDPTIWERCLDLRDWIWETLEDRFAKKAAAGDDVDDANNDDQQLRLLGLDDDRATLSLFGVTLCIRRPRQYEGPIPPPSSSSSSSVDNLSSNSVAEAEYARYGVRPPRYTERTALLPQQPTLRSIRSEQPPCMQPMFIPTPNAFIYAPYPSYQATDSGRSSPTRSITPPGSPSRRSSCPPRSALCASPKYGNNNANMLYSLWAVLTGFKPGSSPTSGASSPPKTVRFSGKNDILEYTKAEWEPTDYYEPDFSHLQRIPNAPYPQKFEVRIHIGNNPPMIVKPMIVAPPRKNRRRSSSASSTSSSSTEIPHKAIPAHHHRRNDRFLNSLPSSRQLVAVA